MVVLFGGDNYKCFFSVEKLKNKIILYQFNDVLKQMLKPKTNHIKEDINSLIFEEIENIKWYSFVTEIQYWFKINSKKIKIVNYNFSSGRSHYSGQFSIAVKDFQLLLKYIKKIDSKELDQFWL
jgi:hypothetical protein